MLIGDIDLYMKFKRQPRVKGTICFYAPTNKLLIPKGIKRGDKVFIIDYPQSKDDVYVTVTDIQHWNYRSLGKGGNSINEPIFDAYIQKNIPPMERIMVIWKDLAR